MSYYLIKLITTALVVVVVSEMQRNQLL